MGALEVMEWVFMKMLCTVPCIWSTLKQVEFSGTLYLWRAVLLNANSCWCAWDRLVLKALREMRGYFKYVYIPAVARLTTKHNTQYSTVVPVEKEEQVNSPEHQKEGLMAHVFAAIQLAYALAFSVSSLDGIYH